MQEHFYGWQRIKKLSWREIQEMIKNMQKVKDIEQKSQQYHNNEKHDLEQLLEQIDK